MLVVSNPTHSKAESGSFTSGIVSTSWYLEGTVIHYTTEVFAPCKTVYPSLDPSKRDNSAWFLCWDRDRRSYIDGGFGRIFEPGVISDYLMYSGTIETAGHDFDALSLMTGASFRIDSTRLSYEAKTF